MYLLKPDLTDSNANGDECHSLIEEGRDGMSKAAEQVGRRDGQQREERVKTC